MANGIVDCDGKIIKIGDKVRTEFGDVIEVCGGMVSEHKLFVSHNCVIVDPSTPLTNTEHVVSDTKPTKDSKINFDCVVWGT